MNNFRADQSQINSSSTLSDEQSEKFKMYFMFLQKKRG